MSPSRSTVRAVAAVLAAFMTPMVSGCYSYSPVGESGPEAGQDVRLVVTPPEGEIEAIGPRTYRGELLEVERDTLVLRVEQAAQPGSLAPSQRSRVVRIPTRRVERIERGEFDAVKSGGLIAGGGVVAALGLAALAGTFGGDIDPSSGDDQDSGEASRLPLLRVPVSIPIP